MTSYQTKLEEAEEIASRDALTGLSSRLYVKGRSRADGAAEFCLAIVDIDRFKNR